MDRTERKPHTYMDMLKHGVSCSPWKRVAECLRHGETLVKGTRKQGGRALVTWRAVKA